MATDGDDDNEINIGDVRSLRSRFEQLSGSGSTRNGFGPNGRGGGGKRIVSSPHKPMAENFKKEEVRVRRASSSSADPPAAALSVVGKRRPPPPPPPPHLGSATQLYRQGIGDDKILIAFDDTSDSDKTTTVGDLRTRFASRSISPIPPVTGTPASSLAPLIRLHTPSPAPTENLKRPVPPVPPRVARTPSPAPSSDTAGSAPSTPIIAPNLSLAPVPPKLPARRSPTPSFASLSSSDAITPLDSRETSPEIGNHIAPLTAKDILPPPVRIKPPSEPTIHDIVGVTLQPPPIPLSTRPKLSFIQASSSPSSVRSFSPTTSYSSLAPISTNASTSSLASSISSSSVLPPPPRLQRANSASSSSDLRSPVNSSTTTVSSLTSTIPPPPIRTVAPPTPRRRTNSNDNTIPTSSPISLLNSIQRPPARTLPLGSIPPSRRQASNSTESDDSESSPSPIIRSSKDVPERGDVSHRPPLLREGSNHKISYPTSSHSHQHTLVKTCTHATRGELVLFANSHGHVWLYNSSSGRWCGDFELSLGENRRATALEFSVGEEGAWLGSSTGSLFFLDLSQPEVIKMKDLRSYHSHPVGWIFRLEGGMMLSVDETGKAVIFSTSSDEKKAISTWKIDGGRVLWAGIFSAGTELWVCCLGAGAVKVYYLTNTESPSSNQLVFPAGVGPVTSSCTLPSLLSAVGSPVIYLGHEAGHITTWSGGELTGTVKIGASAVLCMAGVASTGRIWTGSRKGIISIYHPGDKWCLENEFAAHPKAPLVTLSVVLGKNDERLCVVSTGRDEKVRWWDGLMGASWIENELLDLTPNYSTFSPLNVLICSWNIDACRPEALATPSNSGFMKELLQADTEPDIIVFSFQEVVDLESRRVAAKTVLLGRKKKIKEDMSSQLPAEISEKVTRAYKQWFDHIQHSLRYASSTPYVTLVTESLVGLFTCIFVRASLHPLISEISTKNIKRGIGGLYGNKGAILSRICVGDSSLCFVNCHLAAGEGLSDKAARGVDLEGILVGKLDEESDGVFHRSERLENGDAAGAAAFIGTGDGSIIEDHEFCFLNGDLNYRIDLGRERVMTLLNATPPNLALLQTHDQLLKEQLQNPSFTLRSWKEAPLDFAPTYKYDRHSNVYDSSEKRRVPAWCDRVLWKCRGWEGVGAEERVKCHEYRRYEVDCSDHRPISARFRVIVRTVDYETRVDVKRDVDRRWVGEMKNLVQAERKYVEEV